MGFVLYGHQPAGDRFAVDTIRLRPTKGSRLLVLRNEHWINFHKAVVGLLKKEFEVEGIMGSRFKPYSYVLGAGERLKSRQKFRESILIILESELGDDLLISCGDDAAIVFVLRDIDPDKVQGHGLGTSLKSIGAVVFHRESGCVIT